MAWFPDAIRKEVPRFRTPMTPVRVNLHTAVSNTTSLWSYFAVDGRVCSHFYVRQDGTVEQYVDTKYRAAADLQGNPDTISVETWDGYGRVWTSGQPVPPWNAAQLDALARLVAWATEVHPSIPRRLAANSVPGPTSHGVSWHRLGISPWRVAGGLIYSNSTGKICPGDARVAQIPGILMAASGAPTSGGSGATVPTPAPTPAPSLFPLRVDGAWGPVTTKALQTRLGGLLVDGAFGPVSVRRLQTVLGGLLVDGVFGPLTKRALQRRLGVLEDGYIGPVTVRALQTRLNAGAL